MTDTQLPFHRPGQVVGEAMCGRPAREVVAYCLDWTDEPEEDADSILEALKVAGFQVVAVPPGMKVCLADERWTASPSGVLRENAPTRTPGPETSQAAAKSVGPLRPKQAAVYDVLVDSGRHGLTDEQMIVRYRGRTGLVNHEPLPAQSESGLRTRRRELVDAGLVRYTGEKRTMTTGRQARVWVTVRWGGDP